jgi:hypothetical protein
MRAKSVCAYILTAQSYFPTKYSSDTLHMRYNSNVSTYFAICCRVYINAL